MFQWYSNVIYFIGFGLVTAISDIKHIVYHESQTKLRFQSDTCSNCKSNTANERTTFERSGPFMG